MTQTQLTTPFGRRSMPFGVIAHQIATTKALRRALEPGSNAPAAVNKWTTFKAITAIRRELGLSDRSITVLAALLSFHPETALSAPHPDREGSEFELVVFPSNKALALRAHGIQDRTLRRQLADLVDAGIIIRRDSPNGKRYAQKADQGEGYPETFGFDLQPLVARSSEFEARAEAAAQQLRRMKHLRTALSLLRRDIAMLIGAALDENVPGEWAQLKLRFFSLTAGLRRALSLEQAEQAKADLAALKADAVNCLEIHALSKEMSANDGDFVRHHSNSNTEGQISIEPPHTGEGGDVNSAPDSAAAIPLGMVLEACPDIAAYAPDKISSWATFISAARTIRPMIGISPDAWSAAVETFGEPNAAIVVAAVLQRSEFSSERDQTGGHSGPVTINGSPAIRSPGGYIRALIQKAQAGQFSIGPILMALIGQRKRSTLQGPS